MIKVVNETGVILPANCKFSQDMTVDWDVAGTLREKTEQRYIIGMMQAICGALEMIPCKADIEITKNAGNPEVEIEGKVTAYGTEAFNASAHLLGKFVQYGEQLRNLNQRSSFSLRFVMTAETPKMEYLH